MSDRDRYPSELADRFQLRLPPGLRDRIKAYAERHGRSMNTEIVRILEREFPEPWTIESRVADVLAMAAMVKEASDMNALDDALRETVEAIVSGRVKGVDEAARARIGERLAAWQIDQDEAAYHEYTEHMDEEELAALEKSGRPAKV